MNNKYKIDFPLQFLWDKWKHHDSLAYSRWRSSMVLQASLITATVVSLRLLMELDTNSKIMLLSVMAAIWAISGFAIYVFIKSQEIDIRVRNTFNRKIVKVLLVNGVLEGKESDWYENEYHVEDNSHPVNLWHTPYPYGKGEKTRATKWNGWLMKLFMKLNIVVSIVFLMSILCPLASR